MYNQVYKSVFHCIGPQAHSVYKLQYPFFVCCLSVPYLGGRNQDSWRLLVEECITKIAKLGFETILGSEPAYCP